MIAAIAAVAWLLLLSLLGLGVFVASKGRGWLRLPGIAICAMALLLMARVVFSPEIEDFKGHMRAREVAALPHSAMPDPPPTTLLVEPLHFVSDRMLFELAETKTLEVRRNIRGSNRAATAEGEGCANLPDAKPLPNTAHAKRCGYFEDGGELPNRYLLFEFGSPGDDPMPAYTMMRLSLVEGRKTSLIAYDELRWPLDRALSRRLMRILGAAPIDRSRQSSGRNEESALLEFLRSTIPALNKLPPAERVE